MRVETAEWWGKIFIGDQGATKKVPRLEYHDSIAGLFDYILRKETHEFDGSKFEDFVVAEKSISNYV